MHFSSHIQKAPIQRPFPGVKRFPVLDLYRTPSGAQGRSWCESLGVPAGPWRPTWEPLEAPGDPWGFPGIHWGAPGGPPWSPWGSTWGFPRIHWGPLGVHLGAPGGPPGGHFGRVPVASLAACLWPLLGSFHFFRFFRFFRFVRFFRDFLR